MSERRDLVLGNSARALKTASRLLVSAAGGGMAAAAALEESGHGHVRQQRMSDAGLPNVGVFLRIDEVADLEDVTLGLPGHPHVTRALAKRQGYELVPLPSAAGDTVWSQRAAKLLREAGDVTGKIGTALESDNDVDPEEAKGLLQDADELVAIAVEIREAVRRRAEGQF